MSRAGRGTIRKISLAQSLAGLWCQSVGSCRRRGGTMLPGCPWVTTGSPASSLMWLQAPLVPREVMSRLWQCSSGGFVHKGCGTQSQGSEGAAAVEPAGLQPTERDGKGAVSLHWEMEGDVGLALISNTGCCKLMSSVTAAQ